MQNCKNVSPKETQALAESYPMCPIYFLRRGQSNEISTLPENNPSIHKRSHSATLAIKLHAEAIPDSPKDAHFAGATRHNELGGALASASPPTPHNPELTKRAKGAIYIKRQASGQLELNRKRTLNGSILGNGSRDCPNHPNEVTCRVSNSEPGRGK
eukprot:58988-Amphidinium_carterae.1